MAVKLRRTLFIGLGGTGLQAVLQTKKRLIETYGEVPPMMGFLAVDTDANSINKTLRTKIAETPVVKLDNSEFCSLVVTNPKAIYSQQKPLFSWLPEENANAMVQIQFGAGQVRTTGRFASFCNYSTLETVITNKLSQIANASNLTNTKYKLANDTVEIHMVFSIGGGTGSGVFIDASYILKNIINSKFALKTKIFGYAVMPDVFAQMDPGGPSMARVRPNGFGALMDLDFLMHLNPNSQSITIDYGSGNKVISNEPPFDSLMLINNSNQAGHIYNRIEDLAELISLGLTIGGSELGDGIQSVMDNVVTMIASGVLDVENKKAWASGMGICEIYFDGNKLGNIYAEKVINQLILNINNTCNDNNNAVNTWIDSPEVMIRENNGRDDVIEKIIDASPRVPLLDIDDVQNPEALVHQYLGGVNPKQEELISTVNNLKEDVILQLDSFIKKEINKTCGVGNSIEILNELKNQISIFKKEMEDEIIEFDSKTANLEAQVKAGISNLIQANDSFFFNKKATVKASKEDLLTLVNELARSRREKVRRDYAIIFYNDLHSTVDEYLQKISQLKVRLISIAEKAKNQVNSLQNNVNEEHKTFVIELQGIYSNQITINESDISVGEFLPQLDGNKLYDFMEMNEKLIRDKLWDYARNLSGALAWRNKSIEEVIDDLPKEKLDIIIDQAIQKSAPLFAYDHQGIVINKQLHLSFFVGLPSSTGKSRFEKDDYFKSFVQANTNVNFTSTGMKDKIVIYRQLISVPVYAVIGVGGYESVYKNMSSHHNFHIDKNWELRMAKENFSIYPDRGQDNSIELWVKGILFGFVKKDTGTYQIKSLKKGRALDDFWYPLGNSGFRDDAFIEFKNNITEFDTELKEFIFDKINQLGSDATHKFLEKVTSSNYLEEYSQVGVSKDTLKSDERKYSGVLDLLEKEIMYIATDLNK